MAEGVRRPLTDIGIGRTEHAATFPYPLRPCRQPEGVFKRDRNRRRIRFENRLVLERKIRVRSVLWRCLRDKTRRASRRNRICF